MDGGPGEQETALGEAAPRLVHGHCRHVRPRLHGGDGQVLVEVEVGAVGLVGQTQHAVPVGQLHNAPQVGADAVVGGVIHQHGLGLGILPDGPLHLLQAHTQGDAQPVVALRVYIDRNGSAQHQCSHNTAVDVAGQNDLLTPLHHRQHHALHGAGGTSHHEKGVGGPEGLRRQLLRLPDDRHRVAQVVQRLHGVHVHADAGLPQQAGELRITPSPLVAGDVKGHHPHFSKLLQSLIDGRPGLVQLLHVWSSPQ